MARNRFRSFLFLLDLDLDLDLVLTSKEILLEEILEEMDMVSLEATDMEMEEMMAWETLSAKTTFLDVIWMRASLFMSQLGHRIFCQALLSRSR